MRDFALEVVDMKISSLVLGFSALLISSTASAQLRLNLGSQQGGASTLAPLTNTLSTVPVVNTVVPVVAPVVNTVVPVVTQTLAPVLPPTPEPIVIVDAPASIDLPVIESVTSSVSSLIDEVSSPGASHEVPEMDASAAPQAFALLLGCALLAGSRRKR